MAILSRILLFMLPVALFAQVDTTLPVITMDDLSAVDIDPSQRNTTSKITAASRQAQDPSEIPFSAYVITADEIQRRGYISLVDVLKDLPGIKVSQPGSAIHGETFLMRGLFGNYYVKILIDDLPIQPSATSGMPIGAQLPVAQAERIEVIYGPAASIYGADAMAGVINIVTKKADKPYLINADIGLGVPGLYQFDVTVGGKYAAKDRIWNYMVYGGAYSYDNLPITGEGYADVYDPTGYVFAGDTNYLNSPYYRGTATRPAFSKIPSEARKLGVRFGSEKFTIGFDYGYRKLHSAIGSNPLYKTYHDPNTYFGEQTIRTFLSYKTKIGQWLSQSNLQFLHYQLLPGSSYLSVSNSILSAGQFYSYAESADIYAEQFFNRPLGKKLNILVGATGQFSGNLPQLDLLNSPFNPDDYRLFSGEIPPEYAAYSTLGYTPYNFLAIGGVLELNYKTAHTSITVGSRVDYREFYGTVLNPRLGLVQKLGDRQVFRATFSTAFRPPSSYLIYNGVAGLTIDTIGVALPFPNDSLSAEKLWNLDGGWRFSINKQHYFDVSAFYHRNANLISRTTAFYGGGQNVITYYGFVSDENASAHLFGIQLVHGIKFNIGNIVFHSTFSANYNKGGEVLPFNRGTLANYRMQPDFTFKWLLEATLASGWYFSLRNQYFSSWRTRSVIVPEFEDILIADGFYTLDASIRYAYAEGQEIYFSVTNLTNTAYYGIGASGGAGFINGNFRFDDLIFNPQMLRWIKFGLHLNL